MSLLATPATSFEAEQDLLFAIFDVDGSGTMDRAEVRNAQGWRMMDNDDGPLPYPIPLPRLASLVAPRPVW
jgi:hypothetical protein